jgi:hypothetical protein
VVCRSRDLLTDRSRRLTSVLLCQYWNAKTLRFEVGMFYRRLLLQNKGSPKMFKWFIWKYGVFIRTLKECKFMEVALWTSTWFRLNREVIRAIMRRFSKWSSARWLLQMLSSQKSCFFSVFDVNVTSRLEWTINRSMTLCLEWVPGMSHCYWRSLRTEELTRCFRILYSWVRASWIKSNNCPTRCDCIQFDIFL